MVNSVLSSLASMDSATSLYVSPSASYPTRPEKIESTSLRPPVSLVLAGTRGICGSVPWARTKLSPPDEPPSEEAPSSDAESEHATRASVVEAAASSVIVFLIVMRGDLHVEMKKPLAKPVIGLGANLPCERGHKQEMQKSALVKGHASHLVKLGATCVDCELFSRKCIFAHPV